MKSNMELFAKMSDAELSQVLLDVDNVIRERALHGVQAFDFATIKGHEAVKRALTIAAAGKHSILLMGCRGVGKSMLRVAAQSLGVIRSFEALPCPCGYSNSVTRSCDCTASAVRRHRLKWPVTEIWVECQQPSARILASELPGLPTAVICASIKAQTRFTALSLDQPCQDLLRYAANELGLTPAQRGIVLSVARTIANLDQSEHIRIEHVSEAVNYRHPIC